MLGPVQGGLRGGEDIIIDYSSELQHHYGGRDDKYGIVYSCKGGFLDLGHMRDLIDLTYFFYKKLKSGATTFKPFEYEGSITITGSLTSEDDFIGVARSIAFDESLFHEIESYWDDGPGYHNSSFSPEDLPSNYLGTWLAEQAIRAGGDFDDAVTAQLKAMLAKLGWLDRADTQAAFATIATRGWIMATAFHTPLPDWTAEGAVHYLKKRNFKTAPFLVPGFGPCTNTTWPQDIPQTIPGNPGANYSSVYVVPNLDFWVTLGVDTRVAKLGGKVVNSAFISKMAEIEAAAQATYGAGYATP